MLEATQICVVAAWLDIMSSCQRCRIRARRWKTLEHFAECSDDPLATLAGLDALPGRDVMQLNTAELSSLDMRALMGA